MSEVSDFLSKRNRFTAAILEARTDSAAIALSEALILTGELPAQSAPERDAKARGEAVSRMRDFIAGEFPDGGARADIGRRAVESGSAGSMPSAYRHMNALRDSGEFVYLRGVWRLVD